MPEVLFPEKQGFQEKKYLEIGWGDAGFYQSRHYTLALTARALLAPGKSVVHVVGFDPPPEQAFPRANIVLLHLPVRKFYDLLHFVDSSVDRASRERALRRGPGRYGTSFFYDGRNSYHLFRTCNNWVVHALARAGLPVQTTLTLSTTAAMDQRGVSAGRCEISSSPRRRKWRSGCCFKGAIKKTNHKLKDIYNISHCLQSRRAMMRCLTRSFVVLLAVAGFLYESVTSIPDAMAQTGSQAERPTVADMQRFARLTRLDKLLGASNRPVRKLMIDELRIKAPTAHSRDMAQAADAIESRLRQGNREIARAVYELYRSQMTRPEMLALIDFYASPVGASVMSKVGIIMNDANNVMLKRNEKILVDAYEAGAEALRSKGHKLESR